MRNVGELGAIIPRLDTILWLSCTVAEAAVIGLLFYRRVYRDFPIFFGYSIWTFIGSLGAYVVYHGYPSAYVASYIAGLIVDSVLLFGVLVELAWSILRPMKASLPRSLPVVIGVLILALGAAIWPFVAFSATNLSWGIGTLTRMQQTISVLRVLVFLALAGCSQLLSIGWRDRELQIATGLGFTSLIGLAVAMLHAHESTWAQYKNMNKLVVGSYLCSLFYWMYSFAQVEEQRREFSPQMQTMLLAVAGAARNTRIGMADVVQEKPRKPGKM